jgi:hypothetical protein
MAIADSAILRAFQRGINTYCRLDTNPRGGNKLGNLVATAQLCHWSVTPTANISSGVLNAGPAGQRSGRNLSRIPSRHAGTQGKYLLKQQITLLDKFVPAPTLSALPANRTTSSSRGLRAIQGGVMQLKGSVYHPPRPGFPYVAIVLGDDNEVVTSQAVPSQAVGDALIATIFEQFAADKAAGKF